MSICRFDLDNFNYNIESNLEAMGLPTPKSIFGSVATMTGTIVSIESALTAKASDISLVAIAGSAYRARQIAGLGAAFYVGAIIGSALMASKRATSCSASELKQAFRDLGLPVWAADDAVRHSDKILRMH
ncbi:hypothetical protein [Vibrio quintilis]|uniref:Uncharacterized protein n=1 Tax=Vibrio quintilis TaxID=1117707 RepID=A0A1M7Z2F6_9VIBR|nr:hypothetical protein [Vibrio quintilis]SHO59147.1 hypothetical protein VQ7734_04924 [Vibrio quintilis]